MRKLLLLLLGVILATSSFGQFQKEEPKSTHFYELFSGVGGDVGVDDTLYLGWSGSTWNTIIAPDGKIIKYNGSTPALNYLLTGTGTDATFQPFSGFIGFGFLDLDDTPDSYTGKANLLTYVTADEDSLIFTDHLQWNASGLPDALLITSDELNSGFAHISTDFSNYATFNYRNIGLTDGVDATNIYPGSVQTPNIRWNVDETYFNWDAPDLLELDEGPVYWHWHADSGYANMVLAFTSDDNIHPALIEDIFTETDPVWLADKPSYLTIASAASTYVPLTRNITINGTTQDLSADRTWNISWNSTLDVDNTATQNIDFDIAGATYDLFIGKHNVDDEIGMYAIDLNHVIASYHAGVDEYHFANEGFSYSNIDNTFRTYNDLIALDFNGDIVLDGVTSGDGFETKLTPTDPTADRTITFPDASGTVVVSAVSPFSISAGGALSLPVTSQQIIYGTGTSVGSNANFLFDASDYTVAIGNTNSENYNLNLSDPTGRMENVITGYGAETQYKMRYANGSQASPTAVLAGDALGVLGLAGHDGSAFTSDVDLGIKFIASENWTGSAHGNYMIFAIKPTGSTTLSKKMRLDENGLNVGAFGSHTYMLDVTGDANVTGVYRIGGTDVKDVSQTLTNKTMSWGSNTFTATSAQFRTGLSDELGTGAALFDGATPTSFVLTNATGLPVSTGISGLGTGMATWLATPSSANLRSTLTDENGSGVALFDNASGVTLGGTTALSTLTLSGKVTTYNGITTANNGVLSSVGTPVHLTGQTAAIAATTCYTADADGFYQVNWAAAITTAATTSSILGHFQVRYTNVADNVVKTTPTQNNVTASAANATTGTGSSINGTFTVYAKSGTNIQYIMGYTSSGGTAMQYSLDITVVKL